jgi:formimidoylglutamate deiminase
VPLALQADSTLVDGALQPDLVVRVAGDLIESVGPPRPQERVTRLAGRVLLPGFVNAHSHAFQRVIRGHTEHRGPGDDDFWSWRAAMYRAAGRVTPEQLQVICRFAYAEMLAAGFTHVVEFHYLHHGPGGQRYDDPLELTRRVLAAAAEAGIGITLLRVAYQRAGAGQELSPTQRRFCDADPEQFAQYVDATAALPGLAGRVGVAAHSVRALDRGWLEALASQRGRPVHAHVAEQPREIAECLAEHGRRPVELLDDVGLLGPHFTAVHATHLGPGEAARLGRAGATACICPTTEANLGDGLPDLAALQAEGVALALGTDSHAHLDPFAELRALEYGERLRSGRRNALARQPGPVAPTLFAAASPGGARAAGLHAGAIAAGLRADLIAVAIDDPALAGLHGPDLLGGLYLAGRPGLVRDVYVGGKPAMVEPWNVSVAEVMAEFVGVSREIFA